MKRNPQQLLDQHGDRRYYEMKFWKFKIFSWQEKPIFSLAKHTSFSFCLIVGIGKKDFHLFRFISSLLLPNSWFPFLTCLLFSLHILSICSGIYEMNFSTSIIWVLLKYILRPDFPLRLHGELTYTLNSFFPLYFLLLSFTLLLKSLILSVTWAEMPKSDWWFTWLAISLSPLMATNG